MTAPDEQVDLSVVMPCLNEAETIATCIKKIQDSFRRLNISGEIVVADNGSTDGSQKISADLGARVVHVENKGYGSALRGGIKEARGKFVIMGDADDSYDFSNIEPFVSKLREGYDLVMGNRFKGGIRPGAMPPLHRYFGNPLITAIGKIMFNSPVGDFNCGLRGFRKDAIMKLDLRTTGMEFASEMVVKSALHRIKTTEVPTPLFPDGRTGTPHLRSWRDGWRNLRFMLLFSPRWLFLYPGLLLISAGLAIGLWLLPGPKTIGSVTFDVHTLLYASMAVIVGYQAVTFSLFTKIFALVEGLIPEDPRFNRLFRYFKLETGLIVGGILLLVGTIGTFYAVDLWREKSFGNLDPFKTLRIIIPSFTMFTLGFQMVLSIFFLSILGLGRASSESPLN